MQKRLPEDELGKVIIDKTGEDILEQGGAISVLTNGRKTRPEFTYASTLHAFSDHLSE